MILRTLRLKNWRNFQSVDLDLIQTNYVLGPNASGKSNLLDALRFLRDVGKAKGGGLQQAVQLRGGVSKLRCLHHRQDAEVLVDVSFSESLADDAIIWRYKLGFKSGRGKGSVVLSQEQVLQNGDVILSRPSSDDRDDPVLLTETHLEQSLASRGFRPLVEFFESVRYLHLVPQLLKYSDQIGGSIIETDPFGQSFLDSIAAATLRTREVRLKRIRDVLSVAVPQLRELTFERDEISGRPHLAARYDHWRPKAGLQREDAFSDGTLRLIAILWLLQDGSGLLLLEEPELSLNEAVVAQLPLLFGRLMKGGRRRMRQLVISTHSEALLSNPGIDARGVSMIDLTEEGSKLRSVNAQESAQIEAGFSVGQAVLPSSHPVGIEQLPLGL